jgi:acetoin utilization deacetylase AcuC-like enzyme
MVGLRTALVYDERCLAHDNGSMLLDEAAQSWLSVPHVESPDRIERAVRVLERSGVSERVAPLAARVASEDELRLIHTDEHITTVREACSSGELRWIGPEARAGPRTWEPAVLAVGGTIEAADWIFAGTDRRAYVLMRPPGHHSSRTRSMGFCLFNSVAVAARHVQRAHGVGRVAIVDWDVHHGNGTQEIFYEDPSVLFISLHQDNLYPVGSGRLGDIGAGAGEGYTVNVPLPAGSGDLTYLRAIESVVSPILDRFSPDLLIISAGQDPAASDPLGRMSVTTAGFRGMTRLLLASAESACEGRVLAFQEGGYSPDHMPFCTAAIVEALARLEPSFEADPMELDVPAAIGESQSAAVAAAAAHHRRHWPTL